MSARSVIYFLLAPGIIVYLNISVSRLLSISYAVCNFHHFHGPQVLKISESCDPDKTMGNKHCA